MPTTLVQTENKKSIRDNIKQSWNISADTLMAHLQHNSPEKRDAFLWCFHYCLKNNISRSSFAAQVDCHETTIYKIINGTYYTTDKATKNRIPQPISEALFNRLLLCRKFEQERVLMGRCEFIQTTVAKKVFKACDLSRESNSPVFLIGGSHIGKTTALEYYAATNNDGITKYIRTTTSPGGVQTMLDSLCQAFGISKTTRQKHKLSRLKKAVTNNHLILIDEAHLLIYAYHKDSATKCYETLRELYDATNCGIVFSFTELGMELLEKEIGNILEQFFRRSVHTYKLGTEVLMKDVQLVCQYHELEWPKKNFRVEIGDISDNPYEILKQLAKTSGLKSITERIRYAKKMAAKAEESLAWDHFVRAHLIMEQNATSPLDDWN